MYIYYDLPASTLVSTLFCSVASKRDAILARWQVGFVVSKNTLIM